MLLWQAKRARRACSPDILAFSSACKRSPRQARHADTAPARSRRFHSALPSCLSAKISDETYEATKSGIIYYIELAPGARVATKGNITMAVRSSLHRVKSRGRRTKLARAAGAGKGDALPAELRDQGFLEYDLAKYDLRGHVARMLLRCGKGLGTFAPGGVGFERVSGEDGGEGVSGVAAVAATTAAEESVAAASSSSAAASAVAAAAAVAGEGAAGAGLGGGGRGGGGGGGGGTTTTTTPATPSLELFELDERAYRSKEKQEILTQAVLDDAAFLETFEKLVKEVCIPHLKQRLATADPLRFDKDLCFFFQRPPTLRLQRGPSE